MFQYWMESKQIAELVERFEFVRRMLNGERHTWEGNTWILDLLPDQPQMAIDAVNAYTTAQLSFMPEGRMEGAEDAISIIEAKYLHARQPREALLRLSADDFEMLVADLYEELGYDSEVTPPSRDGGYDVIATRSSPGIAERLLVERKRYEQPVGVELVRNLWGVVDRQHATKGVLITTSRFTKPAKLFADAGHRVELIDFPQLERLLNAHIGSEWPKRLAHRIAWARQKRRRGATIFAQAT